jgi:hypothetical protein
VQVQEVAVGGEVEEVVAAVELLLTPLQRQQGEEQSH